MAEEMGFTPPDGPYRRCWRATESGWEEVRVQHLRPGDRVHFEVEPGSKIRYDCEITGDPVQGPGDRWESPSNCFGTVEV